MGFRRAMLVHAVLVLFMHSLVVAFFFLDSGVHGAAGLIATLAVIEMAFVMSVCWRIAMWDLLRCRLWHSESFFNSPTADNIVE